MWSPCPTGWRRRACSYANSPFSQTYPSREGAGNRADRDAGDNEATDRLLMKRQEHKRLLSICRMQRISTRSACLLTPVFYNASIAPPHLPAQEDSGKVGRDT